MFEKILKGVLLWGVILYVTGFILSLETLSLYEMLWWFIAAFAAVSLCICIITLEEFKTLTGVSFLSKHFPKMFDEEEDE